MLDTLRTIVVFIPAVSIYTLACGSLSLLAAVPFRSGNLSHRVARFWAWLILRTCGVRVLVSGLQNLQNGRIYVFAANHQSLFDIPILFAYLPASFRILYKQSLNRIPFLGWHLAMSGHIAVDRGNPVRARKSLERAAARIRRTSVVVFPEGTRSPDGAIGRFKHGSFVLAVQAGVPVVPVTISESWRVMRRGDVTVHPGTVHVHVDRPVQTQGDDEESVGRLARDVRQTVIQNYRPAPLSEAESREDPRAEPGSRGA